MNQTDRRNSSAYNREFGLAFAGYVVALGAAITLVDLESDSWLNYAAILLPMVPVLWGVQAVRRGLVRADEMQREIQLGGMSAGFATAMVTSITLGLLSIAGLSIDPWGPWAIYAIGMLTWLLSVLKSSNVMASFDRKA